MCQPSASSAIECDERNQNQKRTESANNRCAGREVPPKGKKETSDSADKRNRPPDEQPCRDGAGESHGADGRSDQIAEDEEDTRDPHEDRHDEAEAGVKKKIPPAHAQSAFVGCIALK